MTRFLTALLLVVSSLGGSVSAQIASDRGIAGVQLSRLPDPVGGPIPEAEQEELRKPMTVTTRTGSMFEGTLVDFDGDQISLRAFQSGGEIILNLAREDIRRIDFPGGSILDVAEVMMEDGDLPAALPYLEALLVSRYPVFPLLTEEQREPFTTIPMAALAIDRPAAAIAYVQALRPFIESSGSVEKLETAELLGRYMLRLDDEAREQATAWISRQDRFPESALGFFVLSAVQFENDRFEESLYTALQPLVFSGQIPVPYLPHCYTLAVASTHILGNDDHRDSLLLEMRERDLEWQPLRALRSAREELEDLVVTDAEGNRLSLFEATTGDERLMEGLGESVGDGDLTGPRESSPL